MAYGEKVTADPSTFDDPQYMFLRERLKALKDGWEEVNQMWENRQALLSQSLNLQLFNRDAKQAEVFRSLIKKHEALLTTMEANDDKMNGVLQFAQRLVSEEHFGSDKIQKKADDISERRNYNHELALSQLEKLKDQLLLHQFLQDCEELHDWIQEKNVLVQEDTYRTAKTIHSKWTRHQAFESEIASNKERLQQVQDIVKNLKTFKRALKIKEKGFLMLGELIYMNNLVMILIALLRTWKPKFKQKIEMKKKEVNQRFETIIAPLEARKKELLTKKEIFQFKRDIEDENIWIEERMNSAVSDDYGNSLQSVNMMIKKNKTLKGEIDNHEPRIRSVCEIGQKLIDDGNPEADIFRQDIQDLTEKLAQQFFFDANEAEAWMSEQELYMMVEDRGKDEFSAQNLKKKHEEILENAVEDYASNVRQQGETGRQLMDEGHPDSEQNRLNREVDDLEQWIAEREVVAGSHELGQDYEHVTLLWERFLEFARETQATGTERVANANEIADALISAGHTDAPTIAQWKDGLNDSWADLGELIDTRTAMLEASRELHKYFHDCKDVLGRILEKKNSMSDELGRDAGSVSALLRKHPNFGQDLQGLQTQVQAIQAESAKLQASYAGDKAMEITNREREVTKAWSELQSMTDTRKAKLNDTSDLFNSSTWFEPS
ncbi:SPTB [Lepeophtheirus salmonis]|uniref:SPTB n=1 Tax=Lepeophtheirus salmonis TaxID=72036 RepID=A0A7R8H955_LEPSM|nr:SPTB [Lepeophtheirus salmonis]CAF2943395.1 SPTB [Lepeophtheirus salmonis]